MGYLQTKLGYFKVDNIIDLFCYISAILVVFAWDTAGKAQEESAQLRQELRMARAGQGERTGTRCTVCLDNPREILIQPCGHVVTIIIIT